MEKKIFEAPEATVVVFEENDILTLSPNEDGDMPVIPWSYRKRSAQKAQTFFYGLFQIFVLSYQ